MQSLHSQEESRDLHPTTIFHLGMSHACYISLNHNLTILKIYELEPQWCLRLNDKIPLLCTLLFCEIGIANWWTQAEKILRKIYNPLGWFTKQCMQSTENFTPEKIYTGNDTLLTSLKEISIHLEARLVLSAVFSLLWVQYWR